MSLISSICGRFDLSSADQHRNIHEPGCIDDVLSLSFSLLFPQYLGSLIVKRLHGQQSAEEACLKLRVSHTRHCLISVHVQ